jgi:hypothetical protein
VVAVAHYVQRVVPASRDSFSEFFRDLLSNSCARQEHQTAVRTMSCRSGVFLRPSRRLSNHHM